jgi:hypothetical protein
MIRVIRSYFSGLKASNLFGRASRLRHAGRKEEALEIARQSLAVLRSPWVARHRPAEGSVLLCAVMLIEQIASELNQPGAEDSDLADALANLKNLPSSSSFEIFGSTDWAPYFESRLSNKR